MLDRLWPQPTSIESFWSQICISHIPSCLILTLNYKSTMLGWRVLTNAFQSILAIHLWDSWMQLGEYKSFLQRSVGLHNTTPSIFQKQGLQEMNVKTVMVTDIQTIFILLASNILHTVKIHLLKKQVHSFLLINRLKKGFSQS